MKVIAQIAIAIVLLLIGITIGFNNGNKMKAETINNVLNSIHTMDADINMKFDSMQIHTNVRDYQLDVTQDSILVYDGNRLVGTMKLQYDADPLGTMILEDNQ